MSGPRGLQLSGTQVTASVLATLTGAVAASYLGVGGTLVGAAVGSVASTMGTEIYKHYLLRSQERLRSAGQVLYQGATRTGASQTRTANTASQTRASAGGAYGAPGGPAPQAGTAQDLADRETAVWDRRQYGVPRDPHETQTITGLRRPGGNGTANGGATNGRAGDGGPDGGGSHGGSRPGATARQHAHGSLTDEGPARGGGGRGGLWAAVTSFFGSLTRRQWLTYGAAAAGCFLVVVAAITVFELSVGKPLSAVVTGHHTSGTSMFGTHRSSPQKVTRHPSGPPSATPTGSAPSRPASSPATSPGTPAPSTSGGTPPSTAPSTAPSTLPSATPSGGSGGAARASSTVTPAP